jgi:hypothetical protein
MYEYQGQDERALVEYGESLRILLAAHGNGHPNVAATLHIKSGLQKYQGQYERALGVFLESLRLELIAYGIEHP